MNLTTHAIVGFALGLAIFHDFQIGVVMAIGALIPDLDREYLFIAKNKIQRYQLHRALFHNFFFLALLFLVVNPFLGLGALSHSLLDTFTSATDRGAEVFFPITRIYKDFIYSVDGDEPLLSNRVKWWVEDPWGLLKKTSDTDLQEPEHQAWRRMYGPFKNSRVADWGIFFSATIFSIISLILSGTTMTFSAFDPKVLISALGVGVFYALGEWWRRRRPDEKHMVGASSKIVVGVLIAGLVTFALGLPFLFHPFVPRGYVITTVSYALISTVVGLPLGYLVVKARRQNKGRIAI